MNKGPSKTANASNGAAEDHNARANDGVSKGHASSSISSKQAKATDSASGSEHVEPDPDRLTLSEKLRRGVWIAEMWSVWPMFILAIIFAVLSTVFLVARSDITGFETAIIAFLMIAIWAIFIADYVVRLLASTNKWSYIKSNALELITVIFPFFRPLLILVYIWKLPVTSSTDDKFFRTRFQITVAAIAIFFLYFTSTLVWLVEKGAKHANITNWGDAMWWGVSTITTVGYGDFVPVTTLGRLLGSFLMIGGIFILGVVSASVISSFTDSLKTLTEKRTMAAQKRWEKVQDLGPNHHYPRWAKKEKSFLERQEEHDSTAPSTGGEPKREPEGAALAAASGKKRPASVSHEAASN